MTARAAFLLGVAGGLAVAVVPPPVWAQSCSGFPAGGTLTGVINRYYPSPNTAATVTIPAGSTCIRVVNALAQGAATPIASGDLLLVVQTQGAPINATNDECYGDNSNEGGGACAAGPTSGDGSGSTSRTAGLYEYVVATGAVATGVSDPCGSGVTGDWITLTAGTTGAGLVNSYVSRRTAGGTGQTTYQVVRVPQYQTAQVGNAAGTATVTAAAWNGRSGGILAFDVAGTLTVQTNSGANPPAAISVNGQGFRGGVAVTLSGDASASPADFDYRQLTTFTVHANKAEGIAGTPNTLSGMTTAGEGYANGDRARGAPGNAGGGGSDGRVTPAGSTNDQNAGGGGGGNGGRGGKGGNAWQSNEPYGGWGGAPYTPSATLLLMGGGGGAGTNNNNAGKSAGAAGGGMIFVRANTVAGTATFSADGNAAPDLEASGGGTNDAGGGGGAGGTITVLAATALPATLTLNANGGFGANANAGAACASDAHGPGGGGAGGVTFTSNTLPTRNVNGALPGLTNSIGGGSCNCPAPPANKVPAGTCIQYSATAGTTGQLITGTINSLPGVRTCVTSTRASLTGLRVGASSVEFATASERDTLAFDVFATNDPTGLGDRRRVGGSALRARPAQSIGPEIYSAPGRVEAPFVVIEEIERSGRRVRHGPFATDDPDLRAGMSRAEEQRDRLAVAAQAARLERAAVARERGVPAGAERRARPDTARATLLPRPGVPRTSAVRVETRGGGPVEVSLGELREAGLPPSALARPGRLRVSNLGRPVPFSIVRDGDGLPVALGFEAEALHTDYTDRNVYVVSLRGTAGPTVPLTRSGFPRLPGVARVETNSFYVPFVAQSADPWLWAFLGAGPSEAGFDLPGLLATGDVSVRVGLVGGSDHEHRVSVVLNGVTLGEARFRGKSATSLQSTVPASALLAAGNSLSLTYDGGDEAAFAFLDVLDLGAQALLDPPASVLSVAPYQPSPATLGSVDYLIVSHPDFLEAATRIAAAKRGAGFRVKVVDATGAYDRFSAGIFEANAVAALVREAGRTSPRLRYLLLVGDDTFDPKDHLGLGLGSHLPAPVSWDGEFGRVPSEGFADTNRDGRPELAIGRLPVSSTTEAMDLASKLERQEDLLRAGQGRQIFAVDVEGPEDAPFRQMADEVAAGASAGVVFADAGQGLDAARETLLSALRDGAELAQYFGHGGNEQWSVRRLLDTASALTLAGSGRATVALSWTCESDWFQYHLGRSLGETLLFLPDGGTVASFGPSGIANPRAQAVFYRQINAGLRRGLSLGEAVRQARVAVARKEPWAAPALAGFNLLGDPSLVPLPPR